MRIERGEDSAVLGFVLWKCCGLFQSSGKNFRRAKVIQKIASFTKMASVTVKLCGGTG
jgi:hypothetical protein